MQSNINLPSELFSSGPLSSILIGKLKGSHSSPKSPLKYIPVDVISGSPSPSHPRMGTLDASMSFLQSSANLANVPSSYVSFRYQ